MQVAAIELQFQMALCGVFDATAFSMQISGSATNQYDLFMESQIPLITLL